MYYQQIVEVAGDHQEGHLNRRIAVRLELSIALSTNINLFCIRADMITFFPDLTRQPSFRVLVIVNPFSSNLPSEIMLTGHCSQMRTSERETSLKWTVPDLAAWRT